MELTHAKERLKKGEELACFSYGPAAVLLFEKNKAAFAEYRGEVKVFAGLAVKR
ncbi:hypothetical protein [Metabacillus indicus]|uniref:hypothetical protein n=1 Tax=Metabacillus indicus TaxID=246786 RepID=UPI003CE6C702